MKLLIGNGHGKTTPGKRSPDGRLMEWKYTREIAVEVVKTLRSQGYDADLIVPEDADIPLTERANRVNAWCNKLGTANVAFVSIHCNASGNGQWLKARGWEAWTTKGQTQGDKLADCLYDAAEEILPQYLPDVQIRTDKTDGDRDKEANFTVLANTKCAACLTENMFQDNKEDVDWLLSTVGRNAIVKLHVEGLKKYVAKYGTPPTNSCNCTCHK